MRKYNALITLARANTLHAIFMFCFAAIFGFSDAMTNGNPPDKPAGEHNNHQASIFLENDVISSALRQGKSDKWYTNGIKLVYSYDDENEENHMIQTRMMKKAAGGVADFFLSGNLRHGIVVAQLMYTPNKTKVVSFVLLLIICINTRGQSSPHKKGDHPVAFSFSENDPTTAPAL